MTSRIYSNAGNDRTQLKNITVLICSFFYYYFLCPYGAFKVPTQALFQCEKSHYFSQNLEPMTNIFLHGEIK